MDSKPSKTENLNTEKGDYYDSQKTPKFIINADDLGICKERDQGIFELAQQGCISSATILVNCVNFEESVQRQKT